LFIAHLYARIGPVEGTAPCAMRVLSATDLLDALIEAQHWAGATDHPVLTLNTPTGLGTTLEVIRMCRNPHDDWMVIPPADSSATPYGEPLFQTAG